VNPSGREIATCDTFALAGGSKGGKASMLRGIRIDWRSRRRRLTAAVGLLVAGGAAAAAAEGACSAPQKTMQQIELMFGRNIGGRLGVSEAAWSRFLAREVTPRFPGGLTVVNAASQWRDKEHSALVREPSKLVTIVTAKHPATRDKIAAIVAAYKQQFRQQSVAVITRSVCAAF
jgi:hypothetical protein